MLKIHPIAAVATLALAVAACNERPKSTPTPPPTEQPGKGQDAVDQCPRNDKGECL